jgi:hypothetical protein
MGSLNLDPQGPSLFAKMDQSRAGVTTFDVESWVDRTLAETVIEMGGTDQVKRAAKAWKLRWTQLGADWDAVRAVAGATFPRVCITCERRRPSGYCEHFKEIPPDEFQESESCEKWDGVPF